MREGQHEIQLFCDASCVSSSFAPSRVNRCGRAINGPLFRGTLHTMRMFDSSRVNPRKSFAITTVQDGPVLPLGRATDILIITHTKDPSRQNLSRFDDRPKFIMKSSSCLCSWLTQINYRICTFVLSEERTQLTIMFSLFTLGRRRNGTFSASTRRLRWTLREECELLTTSIIDYTVLVGQSPLRSHSIIYCNSVRVQ